jgi:hypothetical protein
MYKSLYILNKMRVWILQNKISFFFIAIHTSHAQVSEVILSELKLVKMVYLSGVKVKILYLIKFSLSAHGSQTQQVLALKNQPS